MKRIQRLLALLSCAMLCLSATAQSSFPVKPVTLVVPNAPGGAIDILARLLADRIMVMQRGRVVEAGLTDQVLDDPAHPYVPNGRTQQATFRISDVNKAGAFFDVKKLQHFNGEYIRDLSIPQFVTRSTRWLFEDTPLPDDVYALHVYETYWAALLKQVDEAYVRRSNTLFSKLFRKYVS